MYVRSRILRALSHELISYLAQLTLARHWPILKFALVIDLGLSQILMLEKAILIETPFQGLQQLYTCTTLRLLHQLVAILVTNVGLWMIGSPYDFVTQYL